MTDEPRSPEQRKADALAKLTAPEPDLWLASGVGHLVPLSFAWDGEHIIVATEPRALTTRNVLGEGRARVALGHSRDVVMIDVVLAGSVDMSDPRSEVAERYGEQADWDPRRAGNAEYVYLLLRPERIQVWREANEIAGRTVMRGGAWLV